MKLNRPAKNTRSLTPVRVILWPSMMEYPLSRKFFKVPPSRKPGPARSAAQTLWLPKSKILSCTDNPNGSCSLSIPEWLADYHHLPKNPV